MTANIMHFNILQQPVVTEKSYAATGAGNQYTFRVSREATKSQVKAAVEAIFEVEVVKVQVINLPDEPQPCDSPNAYLNGHRAAWVWLVN